MAPLGPNPSENIEELTKAKKGNPKWPRKRIIAAGMNAAREAGGKMKAKPKPKMHMMKGRMMADKDMPKMAKKPMRGFQVP